MEKKVLLASNANLDKYDNTLAKFQNKIPNHYLSEYKKWKLHLGKLPDMVFI